MQHRAQVAVRGADPLAVGDGQVDERRAFLVRSAQVVSNWVTISLQAGYEGLSYRMPVGDRAYPDRAIGATQCRITPFGLLCPFEVRQQLGEAPAGSATRGPPS